MSGWRGQDRTVSSTFEVIAAYFTDVYFNHIYADARRNASAKTSVTDEYVRRVRLYLTAVRGDKRCYTDVVSNLHRYFQANTRFNVISFSDLIDKIVSHCVPADYFRDLLVEQKDELFSTVICDLVGNLATYSTTPEMLRVIIDERDVSPALLIRQMQDHAMEALFTGRSKLNNRFIGREAQASGVISVDQVDGMKKIIRKLLKDKQAAEQRAEELEAKVADLKEQVRVGKTREAKLIKLTNLLRIRSESGVEAAAAALATPARDTLGEGRDRPKAHRVPARDRVGEARRRGDESSSEGDSEGSGSEETSGEESGDRPRREKVPARRPNAPAQKKVTADFFASSEDNAEPLQVFGGGMVVEKGAGAPSMLSALMRDEPDE